MCINGDSILQLGEAGLHGWERFIDVESGRQCYTKGLEGRWTAGEACHNLIPMVAPTGFFVFQENGAGVTQTQWRTFLEAVEALVPDTVTLIGVLPVWVAPGTAATIADTAAKANIMVDVFNNHPLYDWVRWNQQVIAHPELVYDGQHPTAAGSAWLAAEIATVTGTTAGPPA